MPHKTEAGVVRLNVQTPNELRQAYGEIIANGLTFAPQAKGAPVLVQEMVEGGVEVIAGISQDPQFGPILLFGIGGVFVELYNDVAMRSCPITDADAREMIAEVRGCSAAARLSRRAGSGCGRSGWHVSLSLSQMSIEPGPPQAGTGRQPANGAAQGPGSEGG